MNGHEANVKYLLERPFDEVYEPEFFSIGV